METTTVDERPADTRRTEHTVGAKKPKSGGVTGRKPEDAVRVRGHAHSRTHALISPVVLVPGTASSVAVAVMAVMMAVTVC